MAEAGSGIDVATIIAGATALFTAGGLLLYLIGAIRPLRISGAEWEEKPDRVEFSCYLKNRSPLYDRTVTAFVLVEPPQSRFDRIFRAWRKQWQSATIELVSPIHDKILAGELKITKNDELLVEGELRDLRDKAAAPEARTHVEARAGSKRSRSRPLRERPAPPPRDDSTRPAPAAGGGEGAGRAG